MSSHETTHLNRLTMRKQCYHAIVSLRTTRWCVLCQAAGNYLKVIPLTLYNVAPRKLQLYLLNESYCISVYKLSISTRGWLKLRHKCDLTCSIMWYLLMALKWWQRWLDSQTVWSRFLLMQIWVLSCLKDDERDTAFCYHNIKCRVFLD